MCVNTFLMKFITSATTFFFVVNEHECQWVIENLKPLVFFKS